MRDIFLDIDGSAAWKSEIDRWVDNKIPWDMWAYVLSCTGWVCMGLLNITMLIGYCDYQILFLIHIAYCDCFGKQFLTSNYTLSF